MEAQRPVLIAHAELEDPVRTPNNNHYRFYPHTLDQAATYFSGLRLDWSVVCDELAAAGLIREVGPGDHALTAEGLRVARR